MNYVTQTNNNCLESCIATLLNISIESIPNFGEVGWLDQMNQWLETNYGLTTYVDYFDIVLNNVFYICVGKTYRNNKYHSCIYYNGKLHWDPHESRSGLIKEVYNIWFIKTFK